MEKSSSFFVNENKTLTFELLEGGYVYGVILLASPSLVTQIGDFR